MAIAERVLQFLLLSLININVNAGLPRENTFLLLSKLFGKDYYKPLIVVIDSPSQSDNLLRTSDDQNQVNGLTEGVIPLNDEIDAKNALRYMNEIAVSTGNENDPKVKEINARYEGALRTRCEKFIECKVKCRPKKKDDCKKSCQEVYDHLMMCNQPKDKWLKKTNKKVYEYLKKNPPNKQKQKNDCPKTDECESESDECCEEKVKDECESSDSCNK